MTIKRKIKKLRKKIFDNKLEERMQQKGVIKEIYINGEKHYAIPEEIFNEFEFRTKK